MPDRSHFSFCPHCAERLVEFAQDGVKRRQCGRCGWIHYRNPTVGVAVVVAQDGKLLLGRRRGGWCVPCGHVEYVESVEQAAIREMEEETGLRVKLDGVLAVKSNFHDSEHQTVGIWYRGQSWTGCLRAGGDLAEVAFHELESLPPLIFPTDREVVSELRPADSSGS